MKCWIAVIIVIALLTTSIQADVTPLPQGSPQDIRLVEESLKFYIHKDRMDVEVIYLFENEGEPVTVEIGFPAWNYDENSEIEQMTFWLGDIGRTPIALETKEVTTDPYKGKWFTTEIPFSRKTMLTQTYSVISKRRIYSYILSTGSNWKGSIRTLNIEVSADEPYILYHKAFPGAGGMDVVLDKKEYTFHDIEPEEGIIFVPYYK